MANTLELIASYTVGSGGISSVAFSSIPSTYTDLCLKISAKATSTSVNADNALRLSFNGSSSSFTSRLIYGLGSGTPASVTESNYGGVATGTISAAANTFGNTEIYIPNYAGSTYKSYSVDGVVEANQTAAFSGLTAGLWSQTAALTTSISIAPNSNSFLEFSTFYLYGVKNA